MTINDKQANKRILALVKPEYMKRIPLFVRKHATGRTCELIAQEHPDLYKLTHRWLYWGIQSIIEK